MAPKGSRKAQSEIHEEWIAAIYDGVRSVSSGGHVTDAGDVRTAENLFECKSTGSPAFPLKRTPTLVQRMEKVADEAWETGRVPVIALRFWLPDSVLAANGHIDLVVRLALDDATRSQELRELKGGTCDEDGQRWR